MQVARRAAGLNFQVQQAAQANAQRRDAVGEQFGIRDQGNIGLELFLVFGYVCRNRLAAYFFFAFDQEFDIDRQPSLMRRPQHFHRFDMHVHLAFVVGRSACIDIAVADPRVEGRVSQSSSGSGGCTS